MINDLNEEFPEDDIVKNCDRHLRVSLTVSTMGAKKVDKCHRLTTKLFFTAFIERGDKFFPPYLSFVMRCGCTFGRFHGI